MKNNNKREIILYGITLFIITTIVALVLSSVNMLTKDRIAGMLLLEQNEAKEIILGTVDYDEMKDLQVSGEDEMIAGVWVAQKDAQPVAYIANARPIGYSGPIDMMVGLDLNFTVLDIKIISHTETAGLGSQAATPEFYAQFRGKTKDFEVRKNTSPTQDEIAAISGATITTNAVAQGVKAAIEEISRIVGDTAAPAQEGDVPNEETAF